LFISKTLYVIILKKLSEKKLSEKYKRKSRIQMNIRLIFTIIVTKLLILALRILKREELLFREKSRIKFTRT